MDKQYYVNIGIHQIIGGMVTFYLALYLISLGIEGIFLGLILGMFTIVGLLFSFHVGVKSDQVSQRILLLLGWILTLVFQVGMMLTTAPFIILVLTAAYGLGAVFVTRVIESLLYKKAPKGKEGTTFGTYTVARTSPFICGLILGGFLISHNFKLVFAASTLLCLVGIIITLRTVGHKTFSFPVIDYLRDFKHKRVVIFSAIIALYTFHFGVEYTVYSPLLKHWGLSSTQIGWFMGLPIIAIPVFGYITGRLFDSIKEKSIHIMAIGMIISAVGFYFFGMSTDVSTAFLWRIFHEIGDGIYLVSIHFTVVSLFKKERIGGNSGLVFTVVLVASYIGTLVSGQLMVVSFVYPYILASALMLIAFVWLVCIRKWNL